VKRSATVLLLAPLAAGCSDGAPPEPTHYASHQECEATTKDGRGCHRYRRPAPTSAAPVSRTLERVAVSARPAVHCRCRHEGTHE
jgi:hypothetical protein